MGMLAVATIVGLVIGLVIGFAVAKQSPTEATAGGIQRFPIQAEDARLEVHFALLAPAAVDVSVLGDFNFWEPTALSDDDGDGVWRTSVLLPPGRYEYAFVIDDRWWGEDPLADELVRSFGDYSSVRYIRGGDGAS